MKHYTFLIGLSCFIGGMFIGHWYGKKKERSRCDYDTKSLVDMYEKKLKDQRNGLINVLTEDESNILQTEEVKMKPNGDIEDSEMLIIPHEEFGEDPTFSEEDITYYSKEKIFFNEDQQISYNMSSKGERFDFPSDLFSVFGNTSGKETVVYLKDDAKEVYYCLKWTDESYAADVLGYDVKEE